MQHDYLYACSARKLTVSQLKLPRGKQLTKRNNEKELKLKKNR